MCAGTCARTRGKQKEKGLIGRRAFAAGGGVAFQRPHVRRVRHVFMLYKEEVNCDFPSVILRGNKCNKDMISGEAVTRVD